MDAIRIQYLLHDEWKWHDSSFTSHFALYNRCKRLRDLLEEGKMPTV